MSFFQKNALYFKRLESEPVSFPLFLIADICGLSSDDTGNILVSAQWNNKSSELLGLSESITTIVLHFGSHYVHAFAFGNTLVQYEIRLFNKLNQVQSVHQWKSVVNMMLVC